MIHSSSYSTEGNSGSGVVIADCGSGMRVIGVHVGRHDETTGRKSHKIKKASIKDVIEDIVTINSDLHGHNSYCLICEASRVPNLLNFV
jgi:hypothetical protein